jgi:5-methylcytosine-specific restriction protein A
MKLQTLRPTMARLGRSLPVLAPVTPDSWRAGKTTAERGYGGKWQRERARFLTANPLCVICDAGGVTRAAAVVDHRQAHRGDQTLFWRRSNWQAVCKSCHDAKREAEEK